MPEFVLLEVGLKNWSLVARWKNQLEERIDPVKRSACLSNRVVSKANPEQAVVYSFSLSDLPESIAAFPRVSQERLHLE